MSFYTSLNGMKNAQTSLGVIAHNISNSETYGFKRSRTEFSEIVAGSALTNPRMIQGIGSSVESITQNFSLGPIEQTGSALDIAITGDGFFTLSGENGETLYTRAGSFSINERGGNATQKKQRLAGLGATVHREFVKVQGGDTAVIVTRNDYVGDGKKLLADERTHTFRVANGQHIIDVDITFIAEHGDCVLGDKKDAGFSVRTATSMDVDSKKGGSIVNSNGITNKAAWGKRAAWVDYHGPVNGKTVGVAILNHPKSFRHPTPWHVRTYGLFTANPFGIRSLGQGKDGSFTLKKGKSIILRHRVIFHNGDEKAAKIAEAYNMYAKEK